MRIATGPLTHKALGRVGPLIKINESLEIEHAVYFKDFFEIRSMGDDRQIGRERLVSGAKMLDDKVQAV